MGDTVGWDDPDTGQPVQDGDRIVVLDDDDRRDQ